jgi:t-SNARE complex subunit (syntaxin)
VACLAAAENNVAAAWVNQDLGGQLERRHPARARATREEKAGKMYIGIGTVVLIIIIVIVVLALRR